MVLSSWPSVRHSFSTVRSAALRRSALILAKTCSMGLRSGEYWGSRKRLVPALRMAVRTAWLVWLRRLSRTTMSPGLRIGTRQCSTYDRKLSPSMGAVDDARCSQAIQAQGPHERQGFRVSMRHLGAQALAFATAAMCARQVRFDPGLIDEHQAPWIEFRLMILPARAAMRHVRPILFAGLDGLFLS